MKRMLMAVMAVAIAVTFSVPAFADEEKKEGNKGGHATYSDDKKDEHKGGHADTFGDDKKDDHKGGH
jgi:hypothetical protein